MKKVQPLKLYFFQWCGRGDLNSYDKTGTLHIACVFFSYIYNLKFSSSSKFSLSSYGSLLISSALSGYSVGVSLIIAFCFLVFAKGKATRPKAPPKTPSKPLNNRKSQ